MLFERDRPSRRQILAEAGALQVRPAIRVVRAAQNTGELGRVHP